MALEQQENCSVESLYWCAEISSPLIDPCESKVSYIGAMPEGDLLPEWPDLGPEGEQGISSSLLASLLEVEDDQPVSKVRKRHQPSSPHSVLEQGKDGDDGELGGAGNDDEDNDVDATLTELLHQSLDMDFSPEIFDFFELPDAGDVELVQQHEEFLGCRLFHLLLAGAEAMFSHALDLARVILFRLRELTSSCSSSAPVFQRIAIYFTEALQSLLDGARITKIVSSSSMSYLDSITAFQALHEASPYIKFGHYVANQAILEAIAGNKRVHILDYDVTLGIQWPSLMQALAVREGGAPHLRITAVYRPHSRNQLANFQETKERLIDCAAAFNIPFSFHQAKVEDDEESKLVGLKLIKGETLVVNCMLHLLHVPHKSPSSVLSFLKSVQKFSPRLLTFVEEEVVSCLSAPNSVDKFFQALHHYSAMLDSLEASLCETTAHILVERAFLATRIKTAFVAHHHAHSKVEWSGLLHSVGFHRLPLSKRNICQARLLLGLFKDGYQLKEHQSDEEIEKLLLSWKSRPLIAASAWTCKTISNGTENECQ